MVQMKAAQPSLDSSTKNKGNRKIGHQPCGHGHLLLCPFLMLFQHGVVVIHDHLDAHQMALGGDARSSDICHHSGTHCTRIWQRISNKVRSCHEWLQRKKQHSDEKCECHRKEAMNVIVEAVGKSCAITAEAERSNCKTS